MPADMPSLPKYRHYKPKDLAVVRLDGRDLYLGRYDSPESREKYRRVVAEWLTRCPSPAAPTRPGCEAESAPSVNEAILAFYTRHAVVHYRHPDGGQSGELSNIRDSLKLLKQLYGSTPAVEFSPLKLKAVQQAMVAAGLARTTINQRVGRIVRMFKWAASEELVPAAVYQSLRTVSGFQKGRSGAREPAPIGPVPDELVDAVRPHVARQVWAMVQLQRLTGMRPGEVVIMRTGDLDRGGDVWLYTPGRHKTEHRGRSRQVPIGPRAQEVLRPWLREDPGAYLFSPKEAMAEFRAGQRTRRTTPLYPSVRARAPKPNPKRMLGERYTTGTYRNAVGYGCRRAGVPPWHPNQLRHSAATRIRRLTDLDSARAVLGHSDLKTSEIYAERDREKAAQVMRQNG